MVSFTFTQLAWDTKWIKTGDEANNTDILQVKMFKWVPVKFSGQWSWICMDCNLFITNDVVVLHFGQPYWVTNIISLNFYTIVFQQMRRTDHKNGTPTKARRPRLVLDMWFFHLRLESIWTPRYLTEFVMGIKSVPSINCVAGMPVPNCMWLH